MRLVQLRGRACCRNAFGLLHGPPARRRGRHCFGSDGPTEPARNMGLKAILLFAAYVTMPKYTDPALRHDRWASYIGNPKDAGSCKRLPTQGGTIPRRAQAPPHAAPTHGAEPSFSACPHPFLRPRRAIPEAMQRAQCSQQALPVPLIFKGGFHHRYRLCFVLLFLRPVSLQGARRTPHLRQNGVLSTAPLSFGSLALASRQIH